MLNCLKFHHIIHDTTTSVHQQVFYTRKNDTWAHGLSRAINSLQLWPDKCDVIITSSAAMNT